MDYKFEDCGILFNKGYETCIIAPNQLASYSQMYKLIGKLLFWCLIHNAAWLHWLDNFHFEFMFETNADYLEIIKNLQPNIYKIIEKVLNYNEDLELRNIEGLNEWAIQHELQVSIIYNFLINYLLKFIIIFNNLIYKGIEFIIIN